jgi:hypothetical protein
VAVNSGWLMDEEADGAAARGAALADGSGLKKVLDEDEMTAVLLVGLDGDERQRWWTVMVDKVTA